MDPTLEKCNEEVAKIRATLTPKYQILLDKAQALWLEVDEQLNTHPNDGHAVMAQATLTLLFTTLSIHPQSLCVVVVVKAITDTLAKIAIAKQLTGLTEAMIPKEKGNVPPHNTLQ